MIGCLATIITYQSLLDIIIAHAAGIAIGDIKDTFITIKRNIFMDYSKKKKPMVKKVLKHLKEDVKEEKGEIARDVKLGKSLKKGCKY